MKSDTLLKIYTAVTKPIVVKYKPPRRSHNIALYG
jgi:hypothetical protein